MGSREPSEDEISQVIEVTGLNPEADRSLIISALKNNDCNIESVIMGYFDDASAFRQKYNTNWDESFFHTDRNGEKDNNAGISFHIESLDQNDVVQGVTPPPGQYGSQYGSAAPSRPPSRTNNKHALDNMVSWTASEATGGTTSQGPEDEMQRALRESAQEAGVTLPPQESGVMGDSTTEPYFGPATRSEYDQTSWAMVPTAASWTQSDSTPVPSLRKRPEGAPAFLIRGSNIGTGHTLAGLLTILHEIPLARNVLLGVGEAADSYGFNPEWWKGQEIIPPHLASVQPAELAWDSIPESKPGFEEEIHRLMAFLDTTERSYGTVGVLDSLIPSDDGTVEKQFYEHLGQRNGEKIEPLYQVAFLGMCYGDNLEEQDHKFGILEVEHVRSDYSTIKTLYEALDHLMWNQALSYGGLHQETRMAMFKQMGEVIAIKIGGDGPDDSIEIPEKLYPEKYLISRRDEALRIQAAWCDTKNAINKVVTEGQTLNEWRDDWGQHAFTKRETVLEAMEQWKAFGTFLEGAGRFRTMADSAFDTNLYPDYHLAPCEMSKEDEANYQKVGEVVQLTERILSDMDERLQDLTTQLEQLQAKQRFLGRLLTTPDKPGRPKPMTCKKYLLRGVATDKDVIYVCQRQQADLIEFDDQSKKSDQWWRMSYDPKETEAVKVEKTEIERVLREVWQVTKTPLLIYATEEALDAPIVPLTGPLERFARAENKAFRQELTQENTHESDERRPGPTFVDPISPSKRKHRSDSIGSMDSNRASIGSDDSRYPFEEQSLQSFGGPPSYSQAASGSVFGEHVVPPALPPRRPDGYATATSATATPATLAADEAETQHVEEAKAPEMQERQRPPSLVRFASGGAPNQGAESGSMDMDMPKGYE